MASSVWLPAPIAESTFLNPQVTIGGDGASRRISSLISGHMQMPKAHILLAIDEAVRDAGLVAPIREELIAAGHQVFETAGFGAEPSSDVIDSVSETARTHAIDIVVGVGGGSVLDSAKIIALLLCAGGTAKEWVGEVPTGTPIAPLILVPTTCGTGSEVTRIAMVTVEGTKRVIVNTRFIPTAAVLDPALLASLPRSVVAATGMDALAHAIESFTATSASVLSAHASQRAIELLIEHLGNAYKGDSNALAYVMWASHMAGQSLNAGVTLGHSLAYSLSHTAPMPHGISCALATPYALAYNQHLDPQLSRTISRLLTGGKSENLREAARAVSALAQRMGLPQTLGEARIEASSVPNIARMCIADYPRPTNPEPFEAARLTALVSAMESGDLDAAFAATSH